jgi:hypothetical protein
VSFTLTKILHIIFYKNGEFFHDLACSIELLSTQEVGRARGKLGEHEESWESTKKVGRARGKLGGHEKDQELVEGQYLHRSNCTDLLISDGFRRSYPVI